MNSTWTVMFAGLGALFFITVGLYGMDYAERVTAEPIQVNEKIEKINWESKTRTSLLSSNEEKYLIVELENGESLIFNYIEISKVKFKKTEENKMKAITKNNHISSAEINLDKETFERLSKDYVYKFKESSIMK